MFVINNYLKLVLDKYLMKYVAHWDKKKNSMVLELYNYRYIRIYLSENPGSRVYL